MKYTPETVAKIMIALESGDWRMDACRKAGISYETFSVWNREKPEFADAIKRAEDSGEQELEAFCLAKIRNDKSWQSSAWLLERKIGGKYRPKQQVDSNVSVKGYKEVLDSLDDRPEA